MLPRGKPLSDVYDDNVDQIMHHMHEIHKLSHPDSHLHKAVAKMGHDTKSVSSLHDDITAMIEKHGGK